MSDHTQRFIDEWNALTKEERKRRRQEAARKHEAARVERSLSTYVEAFPMDIPEKIKETRVKITTRQLRDLLEKLDPSGEMEVVYRRYSNYEFLDPGDIRLAEGVDRGEGAAYIMDSHESMPAEDKVKARKYVLFPGN